MIEEGEWIDDGKYSHKTMIFKKDDKYWAISDSRSGSYFTDYYYSSEDGTGHLEAVEVEKIEVIKTEWKAIKK